ncbi:MAG: SDR family oxidoreductase [Verrucomicrobiota bacterium]
MIVSLQNKKALITASSKGIGFAVASLFAELGAQVAICSRSPEAVKKAANEIQKKTTQPVLMFHGDLGSREFIESMSQTLLQEWGGVDILVNNNGGPKPGGIFEGTEADWENALQATLMSAIRLTRLLAPAMKTKGWGRIINLTSSTAKEPEATLCMSNVTRAGVMTFGKTAATELGPFGITVNTILTGRVMTDRLESLLKINGDRQGLTYEQMVEKTEKMIPVGAISSADDFAKTIGFLASEHSGYWNGAALALDGGAMRSI